MILSGDEVKFSKNGNNNTYCHDNGLNWFNWEQIKTNKGFMDFLKYMIDFRKEHPSLRRDRFFEGIDLTGNSILDINWHGVEIDKPDWDIQSHTIAFMLDGSKKETGAEEDDDNIYVAINSYKDGLDFQLPKAGKNKSWHLHINTFEKQGFYDKNDIKKIRSNVIRVKEKSIIILVGKE